MAKLGINTGSNADDGTGDSLRVGAGKINSNFNEVYSLLTGAGNNGTTLLSGIVTSVTAGSNITLSGGPTGAIQITAAALTGTGFFTNNSTGIHTLGSVGIGTTTAENNGLSVPLGNVKVGKGLTTLNLNVAGVTSFTGGDINISGDNYTAMWDASVDTLEFADNAKIAFGAGSDLTLYHDASNSWIKDQAAGNLLIDSNGAAVKITKAGAAETMAEFNTDGPVKLFHNNVRVLETVSTGATVVGDLYVGGDLFVLDDVTYNEMNSVNLNVSGVSTFSGTSNHDGDLRVGVSTLFADVSTGRIGVGTDVPGDLFFVDGSLTASGLSTFSGGISLKDNSKINLGTGNDAEIYFDSSNLYIKETTGSGDIYVESDDVYIRANGGGSTMAAFKSGAESILYHNGNAKATTDVGGIIITGVATATGFSCDTVGTGVSLAANVPVTFTGGSGKTLKIYRDASNSYITHESGDFYIQGEAVRIRNAAGTEQIANFYQNAGTTLYHDDSLVFSTDKHGVIISGIVTATSLVKSGGTSSQFLKADGSVDSTTYPSLAKASAIARVIGPGWNPAGAMVVQAWNNSSIW